MIKFIYQPFIIPLLFIIHFMSSFAYAAGYKEILISISDSLSREVQSSEANVRQSLLKQYLKFSEETEIEQLADIPFSKLSRWYLVRMDASKQQQINVLSQNAHIEYLQENNKFLIHTEPPNDSLYLDQWYHSQIQAVGSWENYIPNDIIMAIIDTGIDYLHPDLEGSLWINREEDLNSNGKLDPEDMNNIDDDGNGYIDDVMGWDFTDAPRFVDAGDYSDPDNDPMDEYFGGHGTKIAGIIAAQTSNMRGIAGLVPGGRVMNLRAGTATGFLEEDDVARAVLYAINNGARVINMSFGDIVVSRFLKDVIEYAYSEDIIIIASSGNSGTDLIHYPSGLPETISVGASDQSDQIAGFSNWGYTIDLVAPGVDIISPRAGGGYEMANGTSFSAPMVTATVGLLLSNHPEYSVEQIRNLLKTSADDIGSYGWDRYSGAGRLNMKRASQITHKSTLFINFPVSGSSVASDSIPIVITANDPDLVSVNLAYGLGNDPSKWFDLVKNYSYQIIEDTIFVLPLSSLPDTTVILKLSINTWSGENLDYHAIVKIDRTAPVISAISHLETLDEDEYIYLVEFETDDITSADIFYRSVGISELYNTVHLEYETKHHYYLLRAIGDIEYYIRARNLSGLTTIDDNNGQNYKLKGAGGNILREDFVEVEQTLPSGFLLPEATDFDNDGNDEAILSVYDEFGSFGPVAIYEYIHGHFIKQTETPFRGIPRSVGDADNDGKDEILIGYGQQSYLIEAYQNGDWPTEVIWSDTGSFWAGKITDLDNDNLFEIVGKDDQEFILLESMGNNQFQKVYTFGNPSPGENQLGPPRTEVADLDNDGRLELYFGDYDGDLVIYENSGNNLFEPGRYLSLPHRDATNYFTMGNFNSPEETRLIVGSHSGSQNLSEHQVNGQYWDYSVITSDENNMYNTNQHLYIQGYGNVRDFESGIQAGSMSVGENDYLFLTPYPDLYLYKSVRDSLIPVWYKNKVNSNSILIHDFDHNGIREFYVNDGEKIVGFEKDNVMSPRKPNGFQAFPLDTNLICLKWNQDIGADRYIIYRGTDDDTIIKYDSTITETMYIDSSVIKNQHYFYAIQIIDFAFEIDRGRLSTILSAMPNQPPFVDTLIVKNMNQIEVHFNEPMDIKSLQTANFILRSENSPTTSATTFLNGKGVLLTFSNPFLYGENYELELVALIDTNKTPLPESERILSFVYLDQVDTKPYIQEWRFEGDRSLILKFNVAMNPEKIFDISNYELEPSGRIESIKSTDHSNKIFRFDLSDDTYGIHSGVTTYLTLHNLESLQGVQFESGNRIALISIALDIDQIVVYPQPVTNENGWLMFSNIAPGTSIKIFDMNGHFIAELIEQDQNGGVQWDLRDQSGSLVSSGIYIYYASFENQTKLGKFTVVK